MNELKPCPFCGGKARIVDNGETQNSKYYFVDVICENMVCRGCSSCLESKTKQQAIAAWNKRVPQTEVHQYGENCTHISNCGTLNLNL